MLKKVTEGYVIQIWDEENKRWISQDFHAGDDVFWENEDGDKVDPPRDKSGQEPYLPFDMEQPEV